MGSVFVEDPTIGNMLARAMAPTDVAGTYLKGLQARDLLDKAKAADAYDQSNRAYWNAQQPPPYMPPSPTGIPWEGPPSPQMQQERTNFDLFRKLQLDTAHLGARGATSMSDVAGAAPRLFGQTSIGLTPPQNAADLLKLNVQVEGKIPDVMFDPTKQHMTPAKAITEMRAYEEKVARGVPTSDAENRAYVSNLEFVNPIKSKVGDSQTSFAREQLLSPGQQAALRAAQGPQVGQQPEVPVPGQQQVTPPALAPAPVSGPGSAVTTSTPTAPVVGAPPAAPPGARTVIGPDGQPVVVQQTGEAKTSTEALAKTATAVQQAAGARQMLERVIGYQRDPQGKGVLKPDFYVPNIAAQQTAQSYGGNLFGQAAANALDNIWTSRQADQPGVQEYSVAAKRWIEPVLRLASGAAINVGEYGDYYAMFIPNANDNPAMVANKLEAMRSWELAVSSSATPREALEKMNSIAHGNPIIGETVNRIGQAAADAGKLDVRLADLATPAPGQRAPAGVPAQAAPAAAPARSGRDYSTIDKLLGLR